MNRFVLAMAGVLAGPVVAQTPFYHDVPDLVEPAQLFVNRSAPSGALTFEPVEYGPKPLKKVVGAYPINIDNDAHVDLVLLRLGQNIVLKGGPDCSFEPANDALAIEGGRDWTTAFSAIWEDGQDLPTLAFGNYVDRDAPGSPWGTCHDNYLIRPDGDLYREPDVLTPGFCALSMLFTDWKDIAFERGSTAHRPYVGENARPSTGWHTQFADLNNDTFTDLFIAKGNVEAMEDFAAFDPDNLLMGTSGGQFVERGEQAGWVPRPIGGINPWGISYPLSWTMVR